MADDGKDKGNGIDAGRTVLGGLAGLVLGAFVPPLGIAAKVAIPVASAAYSLFSYALNKENSVATTAGEAVACAGGMALGDYLNPMQYLNYLL